MAEAVTGGPLPDHRLFCNQPSVGGNVLLTGRGEVYCPRPLAYSLLPAFVETQA
jgi:hypothetical protein